MLARRATSSILRSPFSALTTSWTAGAVVLGLTRDAHASKPTISWWAPGAAGMAFTDALIDHADVRVALVDRRHSVGGHWLDAYPFVRLHQASAFYGVASTLLGGGRVQQHGPEAGLHERATVSEICAYYGRVLTDRMLESGKVEFFANCEYVGDRQIVSRISGERFEVSAALPDRRRPVPRPRHPGGARRRRSTSPTDARVIPVNDLARLAEAPSQYVIVGSGKTATDACVWLLARGVDPRRDLLGEAARSVDAQPGRGPAGSGRVPRHGRRHDAGGGGGDVAGGSVPPAGGCRHHGAHRPLGHADDGEDAHAGHLGARPTAHHRARRTTAGMCGGWSAGASRSRTGRSRSRRTRSSCTARRPVCSTRRSCRSGALSDHAAADPGRVPVLRGGPRRLRRGDS